MSEVYNHHSFYLDYLPPKTKNKKERKRKERERERKQMTKNNGLCPQAYFVSFTTSFSLPYEHFGDVGTLKNGHAILADYHNFL